MKELEGTGYTFDGFYLGEDYTEAFDFKNPIKEDTTVYMKLVQKRTTEKDGTPTKKMKQLQILIHQILISMQ